MYTLFCFFDQEKIWWWSRTTWLPTKSVIADESGKLWVFCNGCRKKLINDEGTPPCHQLHFSSLKCVIPAPPGSSLISETVRSISHGHSYTPETALITHRLSPPHEWTGSQAKKPLWQHGALLKPTSTWGRTSPRLRTPHGPPSLLVTDDKAQSRWTILLYRTIKINLKAFRGC